MSIFPRREPRIPPDERLVELAAAGIELWFEMHAEESKDCHCRVVGVQGSPGDSCDVGHALFRLSASAQAGRLDWHRGSA